MQPTSPTLTASTLDNAIEYTIKNELDTLISVVNHPHLSWGDEQGKRVIESPQSAIFLFFTLTFI